MERSIKRSIQLGREWSIIVVGIDSEAVRRKRTLIDKIS